MAKQSDSVKDGSIAGILGTLGDFTVHILSFLTLKTSMTAHYIAQLIFPNKEVTFIRLLFGFFTHFVAGALVGILLYCIYKFTSKNYAILKGVGMGLVFWIIHVMGYPNFHTFC